MPLVTCTPIDVYDCGSMKAVILLLLVVLVCAVLFSTGLISPRRSKKMQTKVERAAGKVEGRSRQRGGRVARTTGDAIQKSREAARTSGEKGRSLHERLKKP